MKESTEDGAALASADPIQQSEAMADLSKKLGLLERVRHVCQAVAIPLPGVVVVGEQSAGKSSLLENISGIQFPRAQNTCTRMPCILTMLTDPAAIQPYATVSMDPSFGKAENCDIADVEEKIRSITEQHATGDTFISSQALYVRVVRRSGPQFSLIDLPGVTHNADQMANIHEVTVSLVEEYVKQEEVVILCVIPATSDFGNAEVIKLARKFDPEGKRTLGVVTKCDDAARAEASDIVAKAMMQRASDVQLKLGFHCVVNRSQPNIDAGMARTDLWEKEQKLFKTNEKLKLLPAENWGTLRLMEKIARIQSNRVDECLPKIKDAVRERLTSLRAELRALPPELESEADQNRLFNAVLRQVNDDLQRRVRAEFMSSESGDKRFTIAPKVAALVQEFRTRLQEENPEWLSEQMIAEVTDTVDSYVHGYTVGNLTGPQVFINLIRRTFIEDGMLKNAANELIEAVAAHLCTVVTHVVQKHADVNAVFASRLTERSLHVVDECLETSKRFCNALAEAQQVTSTTHGGYMVKLKKFRKSWFQQAVGGVQQILKTWKGAAQDEDTHLPAEFLAVVQEAQSQPDKLAVLEICASLHVYTDFLIQGFVEMAAKLVQFNMVEKLTEKLEERWRSDLAGNVLQDLFPKDAKVAHQRVHLTEKVAQLQDFKEQLAVLRISAPSSMCIQAQGRRKKEGESLGKKALPEPQKKEVVLRPVLGEQTTSRCTGMFERENGQKRRSLSSTCEDECGVH